MSIRSEYRQDNGDDDSSNEVIRLESVCKTYQAGAPPASEQVSFRVLAGEAVAVMGPSGSGSPRC